MLSHVNVMSFQPLIGGLHLNVGILPKCLTVFKNACQILIKVKDKVKDKDKVKEILGSRQNASKWL